MITDINYNTINISGGVRLPGDYIDTPQPHSHALTVTMSSLGIRDQ